MPIPVLPLMIAAGGAALLVTGSKTAAVAAAPAAPAQPASAVTESSAGGSSEELPASSSAAASEPAPTPPTTPTDAAPSGGISSILGWGAEAEGSGGQAPQKGDNLVAGTTAVVSKDDALASIYGTKTSAMDTLTGAAATDAFTDTWGHNTLGGIW